MSKNNQCIFTGSIYRIETKTTSSGGTMTTATLRVSNGKDDRTGEWREPAWVNLIAFGDQAYSIAEFHDKDRVTVETSYKPRKYTGSDGIAKTSHQFMVWSINAAEAANRPPAPPQQSDYVGCNDDTNGGGPVDNDDIPF